MHNRNSWLHIASTPSSAVNASIDRIPATRASWHDQLEQLLSQHDATSIQSAALPMRITEQIVQARVARTPSPPQRAPGFIFQYPLSPEDALYGNPERRHRHTQEPVSTNSTRVTRSRGRRRVQPPASMPLHTLLSPAPTTDARVHTSANHGHTVDRPPAPSHPRAARVFSSASNAPIQHAHTEHAQIQQRSRTSAEHVTIDDLLYIPSVQELESELFNSASMAADSAMRQHTVVADTTARPSQRQHNAQHVHRATDAAVVPAHTHPRQIDRVMPTQSSVPSVSAAVAPSNQWQLNDFSYDALLQLDASIPRPSLSAQQLSALPVSSTAKQQECCICLCMMEPGSESVKLICQHLFHVACIKSWLQSSELCPLCRCNVKLAMQQRFARRPQGQAMQQR